MKIKEWASFLSDSTMTIQERMFRMFTMTGLFALSLITIVGVIIGEHITDILVLVLSLIIVSLITLLCIRFKKVQLGAVLIGIFITFIILPGAFILSGGTNGGTPLWFVFIFCYIILTVRGKSKLALSICAVAMTFVCYGIDMFFPEIIIPHNETSAFYDSLFSVILISIFLGIFIQFQNKIHKEENDIVLQQKKEIEDLNRAQNRFFSNMSHEIRTPINTIIGLNEMILREDISDEVAEDSRNIQSASRMLLALINDVLDMSKIESGKMEIHPNSYETGTMLSEIVNMMWIRAKEKNLEFHVDIDPELPSMLYGDEVRIKQVLVNVLNNAIKYTNEGSVSFSIQCKKIATNLVRVTYSIADTGIGIKKENIPYLFDAFKRVDVEKNRYIEGTGLGLSIVKQLVTLLGGEISVNSIYTKGSTFVITLNQTIMGKQTVGNLNLEARHIMNKREHYKQIFEAPDALVLIVDDNETNLMVAQKLLRDTQIRTDTVTSAKECLERTLITKYDAILMDHLMPGMDGIECLHAIRSQVGGINKQTPIIALTANAGSENQALYRKEGFDGYLAKPINGLLLEAALIKVLPKELISLSDDSSEHIDGMPFFHQQDSRIPVMITTDSVCDLSKELTDQMQIPTLPYLINTETGVFFDGIETDSDGILTYMQTRQKDVFSQSPSVRDYEDFFAEQLLKTNYIIHITMTAKTSRGFANACEAAKSFDNVTVIDSQHLTTGMGLLVLEAKRLATTNRNPKAIIADIERLRDRVCTSFIVGSTEYLMRARRLSAFTHTISKALMIHPVIIMKNGNLRIATVHFGSNEDALFKYIRFILRNRSSIDTKLAIITTAGIPSDSFAEIQTAVLRCVPFERIYFQKASPTISVNCGPGSFGVMFMRK